jgi:hypothetical protein
VRRFDDPGLVGQHVKAGLDGGLEVVDLLLIAPGQDDDVARPVAAQAFEIIGSRVDLQLPGGRVGGPAVEAGDAAQVGEQVGSQRRVDVDRAAWK